MNPRKTKKQLLDYSKRSAPYSLWNYVSDWSRFRKHSAARGARTQRALRARLVRQYHIVEKGLALPDPYVTLSRLRVGPLIDDLEQYSHRYGEDGVTAAARQALREYVDAMAPDPRADSVDLDRIRRTTDGAAENTASATIEIKRSEIAEQVRLGGSDFFASRHSIRHFSDDEDVDEDDVLEAIRMAQKTPSVCNRQAWRVRLFHDEDAKAKALKHQAGNRGFGDQIPLLLAITCDIQNYLHVGERNQAYVDGGMFAMSLVYALHAQGFGTCCLNWGKYRRQDLRAKRALRIPDTETIVMFMAVGHLPELLKVARSSRYDVDEMVVRH